MREVGPWSQRLAIFMTSVVIILAELALMRELALRFWDHLAWLAITIALLGFGVSGTMLVLVHKFLQVGRQALQCFSLMGLGLSLPACVMLADTLKVNLIQMVWQPTMMWGVGALEMVLGIPFVFGGMVIGLALEDAPDKVGGHYAASFIGSGIGGILAMVLMYLTSPRRLILLCGCTAFITALLFVRRGGRTVGWIISVPILAMLLFVIPPSPRISDEKDITQIEAMADSKTMISRYSPQGKIELVEAPAFHTAPGLALNSIRPIPKQMLMLIDGQIADSIYLSTSVDDFAFMDDTTMALPFAMGHFSQALIDLDAGTSQAGMAMFHGVKAVTAVTANGHLADLLASGEKGPGTTIFGADHLSLALGTLREELRKAGTSYPLIVLPTVGTDSAGLTATAPESRITIETMRLCFSHLDQGGFLSVSTAAHLPPRESLRLLNLFVEVLRERNLEPAGHLAMIRSWATVTIVAANSPLAADQLAAIRAFCQKRGFDLVWLPGLQEDETNIFHLLESDDYFHGARALVGEERNRFVDDYLYDLSISDDNKPFFNHFSRWPKDDGQFQQLGRYGRTYVELGSILLATALVQALALALLFIVLPIIPVIGIPGTRMQQATVLGFFSSLGFGFMMLEIGLLQRLTVYLAHPVWASATVISGFMLFGGVGSSLSTWMHKWFNEAHVWLICAVMCVAATLLLVIDTIIALTEGGGLTERITMAYCIIAPLATVMGMVFPIGMKRLAAAQPQLIPWAWSANGFASVLAALSAQVIAMRWGFNIVVWSAIGWYGLAALCSLNLTDGHNREG